ncbi:MAG TPA: bifunctional riboflavin kinase/FAD synthetase [Bacteroidia bacterium]|nr:bifunctional riboflavin kinase/FAD synthetase [Bacteroidia bacterium]
MNVFTTIADFKKPLVPVVTTGTFDGVHLGHLKLINRLKEIAAKENGETVLITFFPHPRLVLFPDDNELKLLLTQDEKIKLLEKAGIHNLIVLPFTKEFSRLSSIDFVRTILVNGIGTKKLVIGYNHHFGRNREGTFEHLKEFGPMYGFDVEEIPAKDVDNIEVSSTKIRNALLKGQIQKANKYLGYAYFITGKVVKGKQLGRTLGYPTANIEIADKHKLIPADGIYAVEVLHEKKLFKGMMSIGKNPTVGGTIRTIEVNIFNFEKSIYGEELVISFKKFLREEKKFSDLELLKKQMENDKEQSLKILTSSN